MAQFGGEKMKINRTTAYKVWGYYFGNAQYAEDFHKNYMRKEAFGKRNYYEVINGRRVYCGWNLHHILPKACGGTNKFENLLCTNFVTNDLAEDKITFSIDDCFYQVRRIIGTRDHKIIRLK